ncbi:hypothetical protein ACWCO0_03270 [Streptomyces tubercidicus]
MTSAHPQPPTSAPTPAKAGCRTGAKCLFHQASKKYDRPEYAAQ